MRAFGLRRQPVPAGGAPAASLPPAGVVSLPAEQAVQRASAAQLIAMFGTEQDRWRVRQLINGELGDDEAAAVRGQLDVIARRVFRGQGSQWSWT